MNREQALYIIRYKQISLEIAYAYYCRNSDFQIPFDIFAPYFESYLNQGGSLSGFYRSLLIEFEIMQVYDGKNYWFF